MSNKKTYEKRSYADMRQEYGSFVPMPPVSIVAEQETEYRCPLKGRCEAHAECFGIATMEPLRDDDILNIKCRVIEGGKMPVYASAARVYK